MQSLPVAGPFPTLDPFLFCVYHKDAYPPATNDSMTAPIHGDGSDFNPDAPYRMYHGDDIPGFPQHPHRGFETITATIEGLVDHADSVGNAGRYGQGDVQWMTAGAGVVHSEMFPLLNKESSNKLRFFQIWLNLPAKSKMVDPGFAMFWAHDVPTYESVEQKAKVTVWAGNYFGVHGVS
jgi:redox-sensitive bicupin YhaK (pirin superfamily)